MENETEIWKDILGYEGLYQVSNMGNVKSLGNGCTHKTERILKPAINKRYLRVVLSKKGVLKNCLVHKIEWEAFYGKVPDGYDINHIDENTLNNRLDNLNLLTRKDNNCWGTRLERVSKTQINGKRSKPVLQYDLDENLIKEYPSTHEIQRQLGFNQGNISNCCIGRCKTAYGFVWKYKEVS